PAGQVLVSKTHRDVPLNGIRSLAYSGAKSPIACLDDRVDGTSINIFDVAARRVVAVQGNHGDNGEVAVLNRTRQLPVCTGWCSEDSCSFRLQFYDAEGNTVTDEEFADVPENASRQLVYAGGKSPVWCSKTYIAGGSARSNILLIDKNSGEVDLSHSNDN
ncbi:MAG: hypothetical protein GY722_24100, partial [bacterium]|nr:hypothetical protein [bacterium]